MSVLEQIAPRPVLEDMSIVIPTLGREILASSLADIASGNTWPACLIVVDQGRNPRVEAWMGQLQRSGLKTRYLPSHQRGRASGINRGLELVQTRFVAITDDDCLADPGWLESLQRQLQAHPGAIITGRVEAADEGETVALMRLPEPRVYRRPPLIFEPLCGGNMGVASEVIRKVGMFDEDPGVRVAEDCELSYRALRARVPIRYAPEALVRHVGWRDEGARVEQYRAYARSHGVYYGKYLRKGDLFIALRVLVHLSRAGKRWLRGALTAHRESRLHGGSYLRGLLPGILQGLKGPARLIETPPEGRETAKE